MIRRYATTVCLVVLAFLVGLAVNHHAVIKAQDMNRVYELRTYTTNEGKLPDLLSRFGGGEIDLFTKHDITSLGYWVPDDPELSKNTMVYMLAHESRAAAAASWEGFRNDPEWREMSAASQVDGRILAQGGVQNMFLNPTDFSPAK